MTEILSNPVQVVGWLLILLLATVLVILLMTRKSPGKQRDEFASEALRREGEGRVVEGSLEAYAERSESDAS
jgi:hypothetical protein